MTAPDRILAALEATPPAPKVKGTMTKALEIAQGIIDAAELRRPGYPQAGGLRVIHTLLVPADDLLLLARSITAAQEAGKP